MERPSGEQCCICACQRVSKWSETEAEFNANEWEFMEKANHHQHDGETGSKGDWMGSEKEQPNYSYQTQPDKCIFQNDISKSPSETETV